MTESEISSEDAPPKRNQSPTPFRIRLLVRLSLQTTLAGLWWC